ncbi:MAG: FadR family transcriptional regulator [Gemmatimonadaceae bacterium]|nr:FadR family transcriptional regulator [Gemmatimonadaceae bacterium]
MPTVLRPTLTEALAQRIQERIREQAIPPGARLPAIATMAADFGVGAPSVREALRTLETVGVVTIRHGSGVYVNRPQGSLIVGNPMTHTPASKALLLDLIEARLPIEVLSAQLAARHATKSQLIEMRRLLNHAEAHLEDDAVLNETNLAFHRTIAVASGNTVVQQLLDVLTNLFTREQRLILDIQNERAKDHAQHVGILDALEQRKSALAGKRMQAHLTHVQKVLSRWNPSRTPLPLAG